MKKHRITVDLTDNFLCLSCGPFYLMYCYATDVLTICAEDCEEGWRQDVTVEASDIPVLIHALQELRPNWRRAHPNRNKTTISAEELLKREGLLDDVSEVKETNELADKDLGVSEEED